MPDNGQVSITWRELAAHYVEFVQWVAQRHGLPDGPIREDDYTRFKNEYERASDDT